MPKMDFVASSGGMFGQIGFETEQVHGHGGPDYPALILRLDMELGAFTLYDGETSTSYAVSALALVGDLTDAQRGRISAFRVELDLSSDASSYRNTTQVELRIDLDHFTLQTIERKRVGDFQAMLNFSLLYAIHAQDGSVTEFGRTNSREIPLSIPKSRWVERILPALGYGSKEIIEITVPPGLQKKGLPKAVAELRSAQKYMTDGDWDKSVEHCRGAIQAIIDSKKVKLDKGKRGFKPKVDAFFEQYLKGVMRSKQSSLVADELKALWDVTSIAHHPNQTAYFSRPDAEFILRNTTALVEYFGKLLG